MRVEAGERSPGSAPSTGKQQKSAGMELENAIRQRTAKIGAVVSYNDPHIPRSPRTRNFLISMDSTPLTADYLAGLDCALIAMDHSAYDYDFIVRHAPLVVDTRNATKDAPKGREKICKA